MEYTEIFNEVVSIMKEDSATYPDFGAGNYKEYAARISNTMDRMEFLHVMNQYLSEFKVQWHVLFWDKNLGSIGFSVERYDDNLIVTRANKDTGLCAGDVITAVDGKSISELASIEKSILMGESIERQGLLWNTVLTFCKNVTVERNGKDGAVVEIIHNSKTDAKEESHFYKEYGNDTLYLRFADFADEEAISKLYEKCTPLLDKCRYLIIDVRGNGGGADSAFLPLVKYCFPADEPADNYIKIEYPIAINYTERNCNARLADLKNFFGENVPEESKPMVDKMLSDLEKYKGKGFVDDHESITSRIVGRQTPEKVWVITDEKCGSSGDAFVEIMSFSPKVTVVGRPTCGITDYSNCSMLIFDDFVFVYPTSRDRRLDHGKGVGGKGFPVDHYIAWTPEHIVKDVELSYVLDEIANIR